MTERRRVVSLDKLTLRIPRGADPQAVLREVSRALAENAQQPARHVRVTATAAPAGEGTEGLAHRIGRATAARLNSGGGS